jgi:ketosteroid isomerase-like protein
VLADDVTFEAPGGIRGEGKAACVEFFGGWFGAFSDAHVDVHGLHVVGDVAVEEGTFTGTHDGVLRSPTGEIPPTGRPVRVEYMQVLRFRDGKHASFDLLFDRLSMLEQLGLVPGAQDGSMRTTS